MDIDLQAGNIAFVIVQWLLGAATVGAFIGMFLNIPIPSRRKRSKLRYWKPSILWGFVLVVCASALLAIGGQGPRLTLDYVKPNAAQPEARAVKPFEEGPEEPRLDRLRELDTETDSRTLKRYVE